MNYRHLYHAGNFADVHKHAILALLLRALARKDKPFVYIDTHAGAGTYDLTNPAAIKSGEARDGIGRLWSLRDPVPELAGYLAAVRSINASAHADAPRYYPGSPRIARILLRPSDRLVLAESQEEECARLHRECMEDRRARVYCQDGYAGLNAWLPPRERRALVLVDPPYEQQSDWQDVVTAIRTAWKRWPDGVYVLWHPVKSSAPVTSLRQAFVASGVRKIVSATLWVHPVDAPFRLNGSAMVIVNLPWRLDAEIERLHAALVTLLGQSPHAGARVEQLVPE